MDGGALYAIGVRRLEAANDPRPCDLSGAEDIAGRGPQGRSGAGILWRVRQSHSRPSIGSTSGT
jgi:hypothetical protein